jgi:hypothetical protein
MEHNSTFLICHWIAICVQLKSNPQHDIISNVLIFCEIWQRNEMILIVSIVFVAPFMVFLKIDEYYSPLDAQMLCLHLGIALYVLVIVIKTWDEGNEL